MIRKHESAVSWPAAMLSIAMHGLFALWMIFSVDWKAAHSPPQVMQADLWESLNENTPTVHKLVLEKTIDKPLPQIVKTPSTVMTEPEPMPDSQVEINLKKQVKKHEKPEQKKFIEETQTKEQVEVEKLEEANAIQKKSLIAQMREEDLNGKRAAALKALQGEIEGEKIGNNTAVNNAELNTYTEKLKAKIRGNVNQALCPEGNPELRFDLRLMPTGEIASQPKLTQSSGDNACDDAVARAILASEPFSMPPDAATRDKMLNLKLKFKPRE